jgi:hypothetical protein
MIDITPKINEAAALDRGWAEDEVRHALSDLASLFPEGIVDWEPGDEEWGRIVSRGEVTAYVSARLPIAFIRADDGGPARVIASRLGIVAISVPDFDATSIRVDPEVLSRLSQEPLTENVSHEAASVNDIWWATV